MQQSEATGDQPNTSEYPPGLYGEKLAFEIAIPDPAARPKPRTIARWRAQKLYPYVKVGAKILVDPEALRRALDRNFTVRAAH